MALAADIWIVEDRTGFTCNTVLERGGVVSQTSGGTGGYPADSGVVDYVADPANAVPIGVLFPNVTNWSAVKGGHPNPEQGGFEQHIGDKVRIVNRGEVVTNMIPGGVTPTAGAKAYLAANGLISSTQASNAPQVGRFVTAKNAAGYARVKIEL